MPSRRLDALNSNAEDLGNTILIHLDEGVCRPNTIIIGQDKFEGQPFQLDGIKTVCDFEDDAGIVDIQETTECHLY